MDKQIKIKFDKLINSNLNHIRNVNKLTDMMINYPFSAKEIGRIIPKIKNSPYRQRIYFSCLTRLIPTVLHDESKYSLDLLNKVSKNTTPKVKALVYKKSLEHWIRSIENIVHYKNYQDFKLAFAKSTVSKLSHWLEDNSAYFRYFILCNYKYLKDTNELEKYMPKLLKDKSVMVRKIAKEIYNRDLE